MPTMLRSLLLEPWQLCVAIRLSHINENSCSVICKLFSLSLSLFPSHFLGEKLARKLSVVITIIIIDNVVVVDIINEFRLLFCSVLQGRQIAQRHSCYDGSTF